MNLQEVYVVQSICREFQIRPQLAPRHNEFCMLSFAPNRNSNRKLLSQYDMKNIFGFNDVVFRMLLAANNVGYYVEEEDLIEAEPKVYVFSTDNVQRAIAILGTVTMMHRNMN